MIDRHDTFGSRDLLQLTVFSLVVVLGPLLLYPRTLDVSFEISLGSLALLEVLYYMIVLSFLNSGSGLVAMLLGAVISLLYRYFLAFLFGVMVYAPGGATFQTAFFEGLHGYWPAYCVFAISSPFVILSMVKAIIDGLDAGEEDPTSQALQSRTGRTGRSRSTPPDQLHQAPYFPHAQVAAPQAATPDTSEFAFGAAESRDNLADASGFERAVEYLGMNSAVRVAAVVDFDGLEVASLGRAGYEPDRWSPFALSMFDNNSVIFSSYGKDVPQKVELLFDDLRVECRLIGHLFLLIVAERHDDELLGVRVNQACEMIEKYTSERYSPELFASMEGTDVPSPE